MAEADLVSLGDGPLAVRTMRVDRPYDLAATLRPLSNGGGDPTWRITPNSATRAMWTPSGGVSLRLILHHDSLEAAAVGPGADWTLERAHLLAGLADDQSGFNSGLHPLVSRLHRSKPGALFARSLTVWDLVVPTVFGQRVTTGEARASWREFVWRYGHAAPGTTEVRLPPTPNTASKLGDHEWHVMGVERGRADSVRGLLRILSASTRAAENAADGNDETRISDVAEFRRVLETVPGVGQWTSTSLAISAFGDPDVVLLGDLHVPSTVANALAGEPRAEDERMLELLEPFSGHRGRVVRLLKYSGAKPERRGPKYNPLPIAEM